MQVMPYREEEFSTTGIITRPHRRHMDPWSLELLIMLRSNKDIWGYGTLQAMIDRRKKQNRDAAIARSSASKRQRDEDSEMEENVLTLLMRKTCAIASSAKYQNKIKYIHLLLLLTWVFNYYTEKAL